MDFWLREWISTGFLERSVFHPKFDTLCSIKKNLLQTPFCLLWPENKEEIESEPFLLYWINSKINKNCHNFDWLTYWFKQIPLLFAIYTLQTHPTNRCSVPNSFLNYSRPLCCLWGHCAVAKKTFISEFLFSLGANRKKWALGANHNASSPPPPLQDFKELLK